MPLRFGSGRNPTSRDLYVTRVSADRPAALCFGPGLHGRDFQQVRIPARAAKLSFSFQRSLSSFLCTVFFRSDYLLCLLAEQLCNAHTR
jgi:hypothetical protein